MDHPGQDPRRVLDQLTAPELNVVRVQKNRFAAQLPHTDLERNARPGRGLGKNQAPGLAAQRKLGETAPTLFLQCGNAEDVLHLLAAQLFDGEKSLHASSATTCSMACRPSTASGRVIFNAGKS